MFKMKLKRTIPREFTDYWWLFQMHHISHLCARLAGEEEKKEKTVFLPFRKHFCLDLIFVSMSIYENKSIQKNQPYDSYYTLLLLLQIGAGYNTLASICSPAKILPCKHQYIDCNCYLFRPLYTYRLCYCEPILLVVYQCTSMVAPRNL